MVRPAWIAEAKQSEDVAGVTLPCPAPRPRPPQARSGCCARLSTASCPPAWPRCTWRGRASTPATARTRCSSCGERRGAAAACLCRQGAQVTAFLARCRRRGRAASAACCAGRGNHHWSRQSGAARRHAAFDLGRALTRFQHALPHLCRYKKADNQFYVFADDIVPRHVTTALHLDYDTMAGADRFGNVFVSRLPPEISAQVGPHTRRMAL